MADGITRAACVALILRYIGGTPLRGSVNVFANKLLVARKIGFGGLGGLTETVLGQGLGAVFQNPVDAVQGALRDTIASAVSDLKDHFKQSPADGGSDGGDLVEDSPPEDEYPPEIEALLDALGETGTGLFGTLETLAHATNLLSGVQLPGDFEYGLSDLLGIAFDGSDALFDRASAPLLQAPRLAEAEAFVKTLAGKVIADELTPEEATTRIEATTATLTATIAQSAGALAAMRGGAEALALVQEAASALMDAALADGEAARARSIVETIVRPGPLTVMRQAVDAWTHPPEDEASSP